MASNPLLLKGFTSGWLQKFFNEPFDPLCIMLAMRSKLLLDVIDELGHSYNLLRSIGYGWIDFGEIPGELPGNPEDYYPPGIDEPIIITPPGPGEPGYVPPGPGEPGYVPPMPGEPGYVPPGPGEPGYTPPGPGEPGYVPPGPGEPGYVPPIGGGPAPGYGGGGLGGPDGSMSPPWGFGYGAGEAGGHVGGGGSPPAMNCCLSWPEPTAYVSIGGSIADMDCDEVRVFTIDEYNPACEESHYKWFYTPETGTLVATPPYCATYTAPPAGLDCVSPVRISLECDDEEVDAIIIAIKPCPATAAIGYTTLQMQINGTQTLTAVPGAPGCGTPTYDWSVTANCGTLSSDTGDSVVYTAPADNANCLRNPTITLSCDGVELDTLQIAVNAKISEDVATIIGSGECTYGGLCTVGCCPKDNPACYCGQWSSPILCAVWKYKYRCNGTMFTKTTEDFCANNYSGNCGDVSSGCVNCGTFNGIIAACSGKTDVRSAALKTAGCCPAAAL